MGLDSYIGWRLIILGVNGFLRLDAMLTSLSKAVARRSIMNDYVRELTKYAKANGLSCADDFTHVSIPSEMTVKVHEFTRRVILQKMTESRYKLDGFNKHKRFYTGMLGEIGLEVLLGEEFMDWSIGYSREFAVPDLKKLGMNIGIKTGFYGFDKLIRFRSLDELQNVYATLK